MAIAATTPLPSPLAVTAPVTVDYANMALTVARSSDAGGYAALLWREAHGYLVKAEESGWPLNVDFVYGSAPGHYRFAHAKPGPDLTLLFTFLPGTPTAQIYAELASQPGLYAICTADRGTRHFLGVTFKHR